WRSARPQHRDRRSRRPSGRGIPRALAAGAGTPAGRLNTGRIESEDRAMFDKFHEECGVVGVYGHPEASTLAYLSLYALQHRGQESAGIVASSGEALIAHRGMGLVADIFDEDVLSKLEGRLAIGHNRYSTAGSTVLKNCQPFVVEWARGALAIAH